MRVLGPVVEPAPGFTLVDRAEHLQGSTGRSQPVSHNLGMEDTEQAIAETQSPDATLKSIWMIAVEKR